MIRSAEKSDLEAVAKLEARIFEDAYPYFVLRQFFDLGDDLLIVATDEARGLLGHGLAALNQGGLGWILTVALLPESRGRGLGSALLRELDRRLESRGAQRIRATVAPSNRASLQLFDAAGFDRIGGESDWFGPGEERVLLERRISGTRAG